jgi:tetratricopeptide (TPR) repeat protein
MDVFESTFCLKDSSVLRDSLAEKFMHYCGEIREKCSRWVKNFLDPQKGIPPYPGEGEGEIDALLQEINFPKTISLKDEILGGEEEEGKKKYDIATLHEEHISKVFLYFEFLKISQFFSEGKYQKGCDMYDQLENDFQESTDAWKLLQESCRPLLEDLANAYGICSQFPRAISFYKQVIKQGHASPSVYVKLAKTYISDGKYNDAIFSYLEAIEHGGEEISLFRELYEVCKKVHCLESISDICEAFFDDLGVEYPFPSELEANHEESNEEKCDRYRESSISLRLSEKHSEGFEKEENNRYQEILFIKLGKIYEKMGKIEMALRSYARVKNIKEIPQFLHSFSPYEILLALKRVPKCAPIVERHYAPCKHYTYHSLDEAHTYTDLEEMSVLSGLFSLEREDRKKIEGSDERNMRKQNILPSIFVLHQKYPYKINIWREISSYTPSQLLSFLEQYPKYFSLLQERVQPMHEDERYQSIFYSTLEKDLLNNGYDDAWNVFFLEWKKAPNITFRVISKMNISEEKKYLTCWHFALHFKEEKEFGEADHLYGILLHRWKYDEKFSRWNKKQQKMNSEEWSLQNDMKIDIKAEYFPFIQKYILRKLCFEDRFLLQGIINNNDVQGLYDFFKKRLDTLSSELGKFLSLFHHRLDTYHPIRELLFALQEKMDGLEKKKEQLQEIKEANILEREMFWSVICGEKTLEETWEVLLREEGDDA